MTENVPPGSAGKAASKEDAGSRGLPYYEKLRRELRDTLNRKRLLDRNLAAVEAQLYAQETAYLEETSAAGNIIKGFDNYIKSSAVSAASAGGGTISGAAAGGAMGGRRKAPVNETDRVFSKSSVSYTRDSETPTSATSTPNHAGTPTGSFSTGPEKDKKKKKVNVAEDLSEADSSRANKRQKFSFGATRKGHDD